MLEKKKMINENVFNKIKQILFKFQKFQKLKYLAELKNFIKLFEF